MAEFDRIIPRGERLRREGRVHPIGLARRLLVRLVQLALIQVARRSLESPWVSRAVQSKVFRELGLVGWLEPIPGYLAIGCSLLTLAVLLAAAFDVLRWRSTLFILTDQRLLARYGVLDRLVFDTPLDTVADMAHSQGLLARRLGYGDLLVRTPASGNRPLEYLADLDGFRQAVERARQARLGALHRAAAAATPMAAGAAPSRADRPRRP